MTVRSPGQDAGSVALADRRGRGDWSGDVAALLLGVRRLPVPAGGDLGRVRWYLRYGLSYRDVEELQAGLRCLCATRDGSAKA
jgi:hypothetical protein